MPIEVAILVYPGFELLDASGPVSVFSTANFVLEQRKKEPAYGVTIVSPMGGAVRSSSGVGVDTKPLSKRPPTKLHTFLVAGAEAGPLREVLKDPIVRERARAGLKNRTDTAPFAQEPLCSPISI